MNKILLIIGFILCITTNFLFAQDSQIQRKKIAIVYRENYKLKYIDIQIKNYLDSIGYKTSLIDAEAPISSTNGFDLILISANVSARALGGKYKDINIPVMIWESDIQDDMRYTGKLREGDFGKGIKDHYIWLVNAPHPMSAGIPSGIAVAFEGDQLIGWGKPGLGANIIATLPGQPEKAIIYGYEKGATMDYDFLAPARRTMFLLNNETFPYLTKDGLRLFNAAIAWTIGLK
ncbi:hypothetical protein [Rhizosphaericola mali]|uniref:DUF4350 domain-containing protein n=1 Tax=Rhizosphaericola mali TaxID=2545455 RepID=A0A5P2G178_9BACT|nr:hypothetical protein [Rhizosphaericola mali]QES88438.1 hypothetical protein E0W69_007110 [Rhizosphaericola mali]